MMQRVRGRRGYALLIVLVFVVLFLSLLGVAWRRIGSVLRIAQAQTSQSQKNEGCLGALSAAMGLLETGRPPENPCMRRTTITLASGEQRFFLVTFQRDDTPPADNASPHEQWSVTVAQQSAQPSGVADLPASF